MSTKYSFLVPNYFWKLVCGMLKLFQERLLYWIQVIPDTPVRTVNLLCNRPSLGKESSYFHVLVKVKTLSYFTNTWYPYANREPFSQSSHSWETCNSLRSCWGLVSVISLHPTWIHSFWQMAPRLVNCIHRRDSKAFSNCLAIYSH